MSNYYHTKVKVLRVDEDRHRFIVELDGKLYQVAQLAYQRQRPKPDYIDCVCSSTDRGGIYLSQDLHKLMSQFYSIGDEADFVISNRSSTNDDFVLEDEYGFTALMSRTSAINPALTPRVRCRVLNFNARNMEVRLVRILGAENSEFSISEDEFAGIIGQSDWNTPMFRSLIFGDTDSEMFNVECSSFIQRMAMGVSREDLPDILSDIRKRCLSALSSKNFLPRCKEGERTLLEQRLSDVIEQTDYCLQAIRLVTDGEAPEYVGQVLSTLADSAYIYHPRERFGVMQSVFLFDTELMDRLIPDILSVLRSQKAVLWLRPPFQRQWIRLLQLYINRMYADNDRLSMDVNARETMVNVLVLELTLSRHLTSPHPDKSLYMSALYRLVSLMNVSDPMKTLNKAFDALFIDDEFDATLPFDGDDAFVLANMLCSQLQSDSSEDFVPATFSSGQYQVLITRDSIVVQPCADEAGSDSGVLPHTLNLWHGLSVRLGGKLPSELRAKHYSSVDQYRKLWGYIYKAVTSPERVVPKPVYKSLDVDDQTQIVVTRRTMQPHVFECEIVNDDVVGRGTLDILTECSPYYPGELSVSTFEVDGKPLILDVYVKSINADGSYVFSMKDFITDYMEQCRERLNYDSVLTCIVNNARPTAKCVPAISSDGLSVSIDPGTEMSIADLPKGIVVDVSNISQGTNGFIGSTFLKYSDIRHISVGEAFHNLMVGYAEGNVYSAQSEDTGNGGDADVRTVDDRHIHELMNIIDAKATIENDNINAYNCLCYCRLLAVLLGDKERDGYYANRLQLLEILSDFALFDSVSSERIKCIANSDAAVFERNVLLKHDFEQLRVIGCIDTDDYYDFLYKCSLNNEDPQLKQLASLVMAHNTVKKAGLFTQAGDILDKIRVLLKLNKTHSNKKNYGTEDFHTEFKTSIIYPETSMRVDIKAQRLKVMQEICAFLNADGGTLYLGVSDIGYQMGIDEDLKHNLFKGSRDKYEVYVGDCVARDLGQEAAHYVRTHYDDTITGDVLVVDIKPCPNPVMVDGEYYERMGTSARRVNDTYREGFLEQRRKWAHDNFAMQNAAEADRQVASGAASSGTHADSGESAANAGVGDVGDGNSIQTSRYRNNILHDYDDFDNYIPCVAVVCLLDNADFKVIDDDDYQPALLKLAIHEEDVNGWLMLVYDTGCVCRVSVAQLLERGRCHIFKRYASARLVYASIAHDDDCLCVGLADSKGGRYLRFDDVCGYEQLGMQSAGTCPVDCSFDSVFYAEVVAKDKAPCDCGMSRKSLGVNIKSVDGRKCVEALRGLQ